MTSDEENTVRADVEMMARRARVAARALALASRSVKDGALTAMAQALTQHCADILSANARDVAAARSRGTPANLIDRLRLDAPRLEDMARALESLATLPDPVGEVQRGYTLANGLKVRQVRVPMGVVGMIYEARPNVTADAAGLALKSGNAVMLRGGGAAEQTNAVIVDVLREAVESAGLPADAIQTIDRYGREGAVELMRAHGLVDVLIPRGGADLIATVVEQSRVPVIETGVGNCHVYVDESADLPQALGIVLNSKVQRCSVCNAAESLLVHRAIAHDFLALALPALAANGVIIHGDDETAVLAPAGVDVIQATEADWAKEYLALEIAVRVVDGLDEAIDHINRYSTGHTEAICTRDLTAAQRFTAEIDSAVVNVNASTRFTDGGQFGLGAEIGISTQKLHARGPMGLAELTTTKWIVEGSGQVRA